LGINRQLENLKSHEITAIISEGKDDQKLHEGIKTQLLPEEQTGPLQDN